MPIAEEASWRSPCPTRPPSSAPAWRGGGTPQPAPIWFLWDRESVRLYSDHRAKRLAHLRANPHVAFHLDGDGAGGDIVVLAGEAVEEPDEPPVHENGAYLAKYGERINGSWGSAENFASTYSVAVRVHPRRIRGH
jgi:PPOX class probable F420-dependent enzyme